LSGGLFERDHFYDYRIVSLYHFISHRLLGLLLFFVCIFYLAISFFVIRTFFGMFCIFRYLCVTV